MKNSMILFFTSIFAVLMSVNGQVISVLSPNMDFSMSDENIDISDPEIKFLAEELKNETKKVHNHHKKYKSKFDVPVSKANYTDAHNNTHPLWAKPFFDKEYTSFDQIYYSNETNSKPSSHDIYAQFNKKAMCLKRCYQKANAFGISSESKKKQKLYLNCKICCIKEQLNELRQMRGESVDPTDATKGHCSVQYAAEYKKF